MHAENSVDAIEGTRLDRHARTDGDFFGRLEYQAHFAMNLIAHLHEDARGTEKHGDVTVVAARVHDAGIFRTRREGPCVREQAMRQYRHEEQRAFSGCP